MLYASVENIDLAALFIFHSGRSKIQSSFTQLLEKRSGKMGKGLDVCIRLLIPEFLLNDLALSFVLIIAVI